MSACPNNIWNHTNGCACVANGSTTGEATGVTLTPRSRQPQRLMLGRSKVREVSHDQAAAALRPGDEFVREAPVGGGKWSGDLVTIESDWSKDACIPFTSESGDGRVPLFPDTRFAFDRDNNLVVFNGTTPSQRFRRPHPVSKAKPSPGWKFWRR